MHTNRLASGTLNKQKPDIKTLKNNYFVSSRMLDP